nr:hypothetical protein CKG001_33350 [Bdellovibrio sp. CKG001]
MAGPNLILADDLAAQTSTGRKRSRLLQDNAIQLAQKLKLNLEIVFVADLKPSWFKNENLNFIMSEFDGIRSQVLKRMKKSQVTAKLDLKYGIPAEEILAATKSAADCRMLIMGTQGKKGLKKLLLGSVAEEVIRNASLPVFVLGPVAQEKNRIINFRKELNVLFLTDFSSSSISAEKFLMNFSKEVPTSVQMVHSIGEQVLKIKESFYQTGAIPFDLEKMFSQMSDDAYRDLQRTVQRWEKNGLKINFKLLTREAHLEDSLRGLLDEADLVVMGTHGRNMVLRAFLGSIARRIILKSPAPVIVIRANNTTPRSGAKK